MKRFTELETLCDLAREHPDLRDCVLQGIDLADFDLGVVAVEGAVFLGCRFRSEADLVSVLTRGALVFPRIEDRPYDPHRARLYTWRELQKGWTETEDDSLDHRIYKHEQAHRARRESDILECLAQRIHDHAIDDALEELLRGRRPVGIMGGHGVSRTDPSFAKVARIARRLTREGYFVLSGGGPGIMEAANLGAWLAPHPDAALDDSLALLAAAPLYTSDGYREAALRVLDAWPTGAESLAVPTWFYGHEPSNLFGTHIAKYFANSLREDGLLAIAVHGVIYAPGSAGTLQEVFMDLCQNHYKTFVHRSPMVFLGRDHWEREVPVLPLLRSFATKGGYEHLLRATDDEEDAVDFVLTHPPE